MIIVGRIFEILVISEKVAQIIIRKKDKDGKVVPVAISVFGYWRDKAVKELKPRDKIKGNLYLKSKIYNGRYYTDVFFREIYVIEPAPVKLKRQDGALFDTETGEVHVQD